jgi:uncharacterized protein YndB with AHSA1/START domain
MKPTITDSIDIAAPAERVWKLLTDPEETPKYMFGCRTVSDWKVGSRLDWVGTFDGRTVVAVTGTILELQRPRRLRYTTFDPNAQYRDVPENHLVVDFELKERASGVTLVVSQGDYSKVQDGEKRYQDTIAGWPKVLAQVKALAEQ